MATVNFYLDRPFQPGITKWDIAEALKLKKNISGLLNPRETMIRLFITFPQRKILKYSTGEKIYAVQWDFAKRSVKGNFNGALSLNARLSFLKTSVLQAVRAAITDNPSLSLAQIDKIVRDILQGETPRFDKKTFLQYLDDYIEEQKFLLKEKTIKKFTSFRNVLNKFFNDENVEFEARLFYFESVDDQFDLAFRTFLYGRKNVNNTVAKAYESLRTFMKWGKRKKFHSNTSYEDFKISREKKDVVFLNLDELAALRKLDLKMGTAERTTRDIFLFTAFTGQRISDAKNICVKDLYFREDGVIDWHLHQQKNHKTVKIELPLLDKAKEMIMPYHQLKETTPMSKLFNEYSEPHMNRTLKTLCKRAGINEITSIVQYRNKEKVETVLPKFEFISMHSGRRSFVSNSLILGVSPEIIKECTGHSNLKTMAKYLGIQYETKRKFLFESWQK
jgi:integrase